MEFQSLPLLKILYNQRGLSARRTKRLLKFLNQNSCTRSRTGDFLKFLTLCPLMVKFACLWVFFLLVQISPCSWGFSMLVMFLSHFCWVLSLPYHIPPFLVWTWLPVGPFPCHLFFKLIPLLVVHCWFNTSFHPHPRLPPGHSNPRSVHYCVVLRYYYCFIGWLWLEIFLFYFIKYKHFRN